MNANLQNTKTELIQWLSAVEDSVVLEKILAIKNSEDWWDKISIAEKKSIEKGISDADGNKLSTNDKAKDIYGRWL